MSACISRHGEYSDHVGNALYCERCGALNERRLEALEDVADKARTLTALYAADDDVTVDDALDAEDDLTAALAALDGGEGE